MVICLENHDGVACLEKLSRGDQATDASSHYDDVGPIS